MQIYCYEMNYVIHLKDGLVVMLKVLFTNQRFLVPFKQIIVLYCKQYMQ